MLAALCDALGVAVHRRDALLAPRPPRTTDGIWAKHWYANVEQSSRFGPTVPRTSPFPTTCATCSHAASRSTRPCSSTV